MPKLTDRSAISTNINEDLLIHVVDETTTATSYKATLSQLYGVFVKNSSAGSGSVDYVARWTAANELGTGVIQDDGSRTGINAAPETNAEGRMLKMQADTGSGSIYVENTGQTSAGGRYTGVQAYIGEANTSNTGIFGIARDATEANIGVVGQALEYDTSGVGVGCYGFFGSFGDAKITIDYTGKQGVGMAGTTVAEGEIGVLGMVESSQTHNSLAQYAIWGQVELTGTNTSAKNQAYVYYSKGVNGNGTGNHSIDNAYHIFLEAHSSTVNTQAYGIYQAGADELNYFAGQISINDSTPSSGTKLSVVGGSSDTLVTKSEYTSTGSAFFPHSAFQAHVNPSASVGSNGVVGIHGKWGGNYNILSTQIKAAIWSTAVSTESLTSLYSMRADGVEAANGHTIGTAFACFVGANRTSGTGAISTKYGIYQNGTADLNLFRGNVECEKQIKAGTDYGNTFSSNTWNFNCDLGMTQKVDAQGMTAGGTITFSNELEGSTYSIVFVQGSGTYDVVLPLGYWLNDTPPFDFSTLADNERALITASYIDGDWYFAVKDLTFYNPAP